MDFYWLCTDGACRHTLNLASNRLGFSIPCHDDLVGSGVVCIGLATNNIIEYQASHRSSNVEVASQDVRNLVVLMDSQLVVCHLNHVYTIEIPCFSISSRRVRLLERSFEAITYRHIPREDNAAC